MKKSILFLAVIWAILFTPVYSQPMKKVAQTGLQFLRVDAGSRAAAMGGSYIMIGKDATAMFYNPAGIAFMENNADIFFGRTNWIAGISYNVGGAVVNLKNWGHVGLSFITSDYGEIIGTQVSSSAAGFIETDANLDVGAYAVGFSYAKALTNKFTVGGQIKYAAQSLSESILTAGTAPIQNKVSGIAYDFGTIFYPGFKSFCLGMSVRNFSSEFKYQKEGFQLPLTFVVGFAMDVRDIFGEHTNPLLLSIDAIHPRDYTERINVGGEYCFMNMISLRAGYKFNYDLESYSGGIGFKRNVGGVLFDLGYSYSAFDVFNDVSRMSLQIAF
jgi:hypothetical protein